ncbi:response regulator transcription factor [Kitasatospora sp. NPDC088351]|uniref:response regulator transcription factor n=1 Tax=Kitasatospora sp. NPDC088351 TaxID=3155180 RepID=UPI003436EAF9
MGSTKSSLARNPISSGGNCETYGSPMDCLAPDAFGRRASLPAGRSPVQTEILLIIEDGIRRYSIEGMLRSLNIHLTVQSITDIEDLSAFCSGQLVILDSGALGSAPGDIAENLRIQNLHLLILVDSAGAVKQAWADHANGFLDWADLSPETLREAIADVKAGRFHVSATLARRSLTAPDQAGDDTTAKRASMVALTAREHQVLGLIAEGLSNRQVARSLSISENGVKRTVGIILAKLNCPNRTLAVVRAMESGLLDM